MVFFLLALALLGGELWILKLWEARRPLHRGDAPEEIAITGMAGSS
jgi:hypothetical protein